MLVWFCITFLNVVFVHILEALDPADVIPTFWLYCYSIQEQHLMLQDYTVHALFRQLTNQAQLDRFINLQLLHISLLKVYISHLVAQQCPSQSLLFHIYSETKTLYTSYYRVDCCIFFSEAILKVYTVSLNFVSTLEAQHIIQNYVCINASLWVF